MATLASPPSSPAQRIEVLVRTLRGERHLRRPLLVEVVDRLTPLDGFSAAKMAARALLASLDAEVADDDYDRALAQLERLTAASAVTSTDATDVRRV
jgi:hypothetical protein